MSSVLILSLYQRVPAKATYFNRSYRDPKSDPAKASSSGHLGQARALLEKQAKQSRHTRPCLSTFKMYFSEAGLEWNKVINVF